MPSIQFDRSARVLRLVIVMQLGLCVFLLADIANAVRGYETFAVSVGRVGGGLTAVGALVVLLAGTPDGSADGPAE
ncbi:hypothetical protein HWV23_11405 [Natronomonas halophila]|uniref:hypothetical protein n=1 Tax=Natronomonas halophila TaxID=2747817 RepID=UPI0015B43E4D|nr:hypothetical protein [Natronomonas halophila]QLD86303.1 hypothetical protein HWV23_11405 [Natronomonas halophila]